MKWIKKTVFKILSGIKEQMPFREFADRMVSVASRSLWGEPFPEFPLIKNQETGDANTDEKGVEINAFRCWLLSMMIYTTLESMQYEVRGMLFHFECKRIIDEFRERWITLHIKPKPVDIEGDLYDLSLTVPLSREKFTQILQDRITAYDKAFIEDEERRGYGNRESWPSPYPPPSWPSYQVIKELCQNLGIGEDPKKMLMVAGRVAETMKQYEQEIEKIYKQYDVSDWKIEDIPWF